MYGDHHTGLVGCGAHFLAQTHPPMILLTRIAHAKPPCAGPLHPMCQGPFFPVLCIYHYERSGQCLPFSRARSFSWSSLSCLSCRARRPLNFDFTTTAAMAINMGFASDGEGNNGWKLYITTLVMTVVAGLFVVARCATRIYKQSLGLDDYAIIAALVCHSLTRCRFSVVGG